MHNDDTPKLTWNLRVSRRVKYARLQIKPFGGLEVVIPPRFPRSQVAGLVAQHASWARQQLGRQAALRDAIRLPRQLSLAIDNSYRSVVYTSEPGYNLDLFTVPESQRIEIDAGDFDSRLRELRAWIRNEARRRLPPMLEAVAQRTGLDYRRVSIRSQKTRWGSCSSRGTISLNDQLLFVPADTVDYLMLHELCHTRHLNHSRAFWQLVASHSPDYRAHEKRLDRARGLVPDWLILDLYR